MPEPTLTIKKKTGASQGWPGTNFTKCKVNGNDSDTYAYRFTGGNWPYDQNTKKGAKRPLCS